MADKRLFDTSVSESEYDSMQDKYVTIPPGKDGVAKEGDSIYETVEAGVADWKTPGKSLTVPLTIVSKGMNEGKQVEWWAGIETNAMSITKKGLKAFGIEDKVLVRSGGKIKIDPLGFAGARAKALFVRSMTNKDNLIAKIDSTGFQPVNFGSETKDIGI